MVKKLGEKVTLIVKVHHVSVTLIVLCVLQESKDVLLQRTQEERRQREVASQLIIVAVSALVYCHLSFDTPF